MVAQIYDLRGPSRGKASRTGYGLKSLVFSTVSQAYVTTLYSWQRSSCHAVLPAHGAAAPPSYTAADIEVLEGLEPVRRRPGMFIGGTDERALHHLVAELLDNAMDEAVAGHASWIEVRLEAGGAVTVRDNGRGIPVDPHPKFPDRSALEVILTTLHSGGKFSAKVYQTAGGLHGVGLSVVNALAEELEVEVARNRAAVAPELRARPADERSRARSADRQPARHDGRASGPTPRSSARSRSSGRRVVHRMARSKAYLFRGVEIRWQCDPELLAGSDRRAARARCSTFPAGLEDFLKATLAGSRAASPSRPFVGAAQLATAAAGSNGRSPGRSTRSPTRASTATPCRRRRAARTSRRLRNALVARAAAPMASSPAAARRSPSSPPRTCSAAPACCSRLFIQNPQFQGQTKDRLVAPEAGRPDRGLRSRTISTTGWRAMPRPAGPLLDHVRRPRRGAPGAQARRRRSRARARPAGCACPASSPTARSRAATAPRSSWSRAIPRAARPSRRASARSRRSCRCAARS